MRAWLRSRRADLRAWFALALATLIVCYPLGLTNRILAGVDAFTYFTPYWAHRMEALRAGHLPLWNPYLFSGVPFLANIQAAVLYPLHWPLSWLTPERALVWSALLHVWLAAGLTYVLARRSLRLAPPGALAAGLIYGMGGFTLARVENINQLNALAWLPALLWLYDETARAEIDPGSLRLRWSGRNLVAFVALTVVTALQLLAGHTQTTFINMVGLGLWAVISLGWPPQRTLHRLLPLLAVLPALALSAAQLLPTLELNQLGLRTGGLDYRSAVSFSLRPQLLLQTFLPPFAGGLDVTFGSEGYAEFVGYIGLSGIILAALGAWLSVRAAATNRAGAAAFLRPPLLALVGIFLALGAYNPVYYLLWRFVPGFDLFRAPARWLELYALGAALLAGVALHALPGLALGRFRWPRRPLGRVLVALAGLAVVALVFLQRRPPAATLLTWALVAGFVALIIRQRAARVAPLLLLGLLAAELTRGATALPFQLATAPLATALRNAPAALLAATEAQPPAGRDRFLSLSNIRYDPGDLAELRALEADRLPAPAVERMVRAAKQVEVLAPNLPLYFRLPAVDGYDGGLLPLHRYVMLEELFLPPDRMTPDGRLAEQLPAIPDGRLLDLTGVRFVVTDKQRDLWSDDVYYDLEQSAVIPPGAVLEFNLSAYPRFSADAVGIVAHLEQAATGTVSVRSASAVADVGGAFTPGVLLSQPPQAARVDFSQAISPAQLSLTNETTAPLVLQGVSLINRSAATHTSITVSPRGDFRRIHSGDVKIYERLAAPGRAWLVHGITPAGDETEAQALLAQTSFDPRATVVVESSVAAIAAQSAQPGETVTTLSYTDEAAAYAVQLAAPGFLVLADAWYPGWRATVDGEPAEILRANLLYRAVPLAPGVHRVALTYEPDAWAVGWKITAATAVLLLAALLAAILRGRFTRN